MNRTATLITTLITALLATLALSTPASAAEIHEGQTAREQAAFPLSAPKAKSLTKYLLLKMVGPAVTSDLDNEVSRVSVWGCHVQDYKQGTCSGVVVGGTVTCKGVFQVYKFPKSYTVFPLRMECQAT